MKPPLDNFSLLSYSAGQTTQYFAENPLLYARFGLKGHNGIDLVAPHGSPMYAIEDADVVSVKNDPGGFGKNVRILTRGPGTCREWVYGHCDEIVVKVGDRVKAGQKIATMGNTGFVVSGPNPYWKVNPFAGTHLHLGLRLVRRTAKGWSYPRSTVKLEILDYDNGYKGCIDPVPILASIPPNDRKQAQLLTLYSTLNTLKRLLEFRAK